MRPFFAEFVHFTLVSDDALLHEFLPPTLTITLLPA